MARNALLTWWLLGAIAAIAIGWFAALIHASGHAPIGLTSSGVGIVLGATLGAIGASQRIAGFRPLILGTIALAFVTVAAEHAWLYRDYCRQWREAVVKTPQVALFRPVSPPSPAEYFSRELTPERAELWCLDTFLITATAIGTVLFAQRWQPPNPRTPNPEP